MPQAFPEPEVACSISPSHLLDLELLYNFTTSTYLTTSSRPSIQRLYQSDVIKEAFKYDFLIHSVLALSAFHLASQQQQNCQSCQASPASKLDRYLHAARAHYNAALQSLRQNLVNITSENCHALLPCSALIFVTSIAQWRNDDVAEHQSSQSMVSPALGRALEWINLIRGIRTIVDSAGDWIRTGPMSPIINGKVNEQYETGAPEEDIASRLNGMSAFISENFDRGVFGVCDAALELLRKSFAGITIEDPTLMAFLWPALVSNEYSKLLETQNPGALLVLAYYCALLHRINSVWWMRGWPAYMIGIVNHNLDSRWRSMIQWPLELIDIEAM